MPTKRYLIVYACLASCYIIKGGVGNKIDGNTTESGNGKAIKRMLHTMLSL